MKRTLPLEESWQNGQESDPVADNVADKPSRPTLPVLRTVNDISQIVHEALGLLVDSEGASVKSEDGFTWNVALFRKIFHSITPPRVQRDCLFRILSTKKSAVSSLIGAPPYYFLTDGDAQLINAAGISKGRVNMTYYNVNAIPNYSQFGDAVARDSKGVNYSPCTRGTRDDNILTLAYFDGITTGTFEVYMRIPKTSKGAKGSGPRIGFPMCRDVITLRPEPTFASVFPEGMLQEIPVRVHAIRRDRESASTAVALVETL